MKKGFFLLLIGSLLVTPSFAHAEFDSTPDETFNTSNGVMSVIATTSGVYLGGDYRSIGSPTHPIVTTTGGIISTVAGKASTTFPLFGGGSVDTALPDGNGGWFVAGSLTLVGGVSKNHIAHILASGVLDPNFTYGTTTSHVSALALSPDKNTLYLSSTDFTPPVQAYVAAVNSTNGSVVASFAPDVINLVFGGFSAGIVGSMVVSPDGSKLYIAGTFDGVGSQTRSNVAALSTSNGSLDSFNPDVTGSMSGIHLGDLVGSLALTSDGSTLYLGGEFTNVGVATRQGVAAVHTSDGSVVNAFDPEADSNVGSIALSSDETKLYVGGEFSHIAGTARNNLAAVSTSNGALVPAFNPSTDTGVSTVALSPDQSRLYIGGNFNLVDSTVHQGLAAVATSDGTIVSSFGGTTDNRGPMLTLSPDGANLFVNSSYGLGGEPRNRLASISSNSIANLSAYFDDEISSIVLSPDGSTIYAGGFLTSADGVAHNGLAAFHLSDGSIVSSFVADVNDDINSIVPSRDGSIIYISGKFTSVDGQTRNHVAAVNASDGSIVSAFDPDADDYAPALALSSDGSILYIGGDFLNIAGVPRNRLAAVHTSNGSIVSGFDPNLTVPSGGGNGGSAGVRALKLTRDSSKLYVAGQFTKVGAVTRNRLAAINTSNGTLVSAFNPNVNNLVRNIVLNSDESKIYAIGQFTQVGGQNIAGLASINVADGSVNTAFNQNTIDKGVGLAIESDDSKLYAGNGFNTSGSTFFAVFADPSVGSSVSKPTVTTSAASSLGTTGAALNGSVSATGGENATARGFVWGPNTYTATTTSSGSFGTGAFADTLSGLTCNTTYHFAAYATNSAGTGYGGDLSFTTSACATSSNQGGGGINLSAGPSSSGTSRPVVTPIASSTNLFITPSITFPGGSGNILVILHNHSLGDISEDIRLLQKFLNAHGFTVSASGAGSAGHETNMFRIKTYLALIKFQKSVGLPQSGYLGPLTRAALITTYKY